MHDKSLTFNSYNSLDLLKYNDFYLKPTPLIDINGVLAPKAEYYVSYIV